MPAKASQTAHFGAAVEFGIDESFIIVSSWVFIESLGAVEFIGIVEFIAVFGGVVVGLVTCASAALEIASTATLIIVL